jgi:tRNA (adenine37-N6)-methyltransferase
MEFSVKPIGIVRTPYSDWAPDQPVAREAKTGDFRVELDEQYVEALADLEHFTHITLIAFLHNIKSEPKLMVTPPWAKGKKVGLFASRSPHRINPIGLSTVRLIKIEGNVLFIGPVDFFDGTPLIDIKPYVATIDVKSDANDGWIEGLDGHRHMLEHLLGLPHKHDEEETPQSESQSPSHDHSGGESHSHDDKSSHAHDHEHNHPPGNESHLHEHDHNYNHSHGHSHKHDEPEHGHEHKHTFTHTHEHHHHQDEDGHDHPHTEREKHEHFKPHQHLHDHEDE